MSAKKTAAEPEYGPLGPGHAPANDPMKGLRGVMAGTLVLELITFLLALPVIWRVDGGEHFTGLNMAVLIVFCVVLAALVGVQKRPWALWVDLGIHIIPIAGFLIHPSIGVMGLIYLLVWGYIAYLRKNLLERMKRGLLPTQHT